MDWITAEVRLVIDGKKLKERRLNAGLSQTDVAARLGITVPFLSSIENERQKPSHLWIINNKEKIEDALTEKEVRK